MKTRPVRAAFQQQETEVSIDQIVLQREIKPSFRKSQTYRQIAASLEHVGLVEPLVVFPRGPKDYLLLDGHIRIDILKSQSVERVRAIFATEDEAYTYNRRVNSLSPVGQHFMILKVLENGVSEDRVAAALNVNVSQIRKKKNMLDGICSEAVDILKTKQVTADSFAVLRKMKPFRQIEAAEHMVASNNYSVAFAKMLLAVTPPEFLVAATVAKQSASKSGGSLLMLEDEAESIVRDLKVVEESYGTDILLLTVVCGYVERVLANNRVERYLSKHKPDILSSLRSGLADAKRAKFPTA